MVLTANNKRDGENSRKNRGKFLLQAITPWKTKLVTCDFLSHTKEKRSHRSGGDKHRCRGGSAGRVGTRGSGLVKHWNGPDSSREKEDTGAQTSENTFKVGRTTWLTIKKPLNVKLHTLAFRNGQSRPPLHGYKSASKGCKTQEYWKGHKV